MISTEINQSQALLNHGKAWKSGRGEVYSLGLAMSPIKVFFATTFSLFSKAHLDQGRSDGNQPSALPLFFQFSKNPKFKSEKFRVVVSAGETVKLLLARLTSLTKQQEELRMSSTIIELSG